MQHAPGTDVEKAQPEIGTAGVDGNDSASDNTGLLASGARVKDSSATIAQTGRQTVAAAANGTGCDALTSGYTTSR